MARNAGIDYYAPKIERLITEPGEMRWLEVRLIEADIFSIVVQLERKIDELLTEEKNVGSRQSQQTLRDGALNLFRIAKPLAKAIGYKIGYNTRVQFWEDKALEPVSRAAAR